MTLGRGHCGACSMSDVQSAACVSEVLPYPKFEWQLWESQISPSVFVDICPVAACEARRCNVSGSTQCCSLLLAAQVLIIRPEKPPFVSSASAAKSDLGALKYKQRAN